MFAVRDFAGEDEMERVSQAITRHSLALYTKIVATGSYYRPSAHLGSLGNL
jgi:hypothetical protein